MLSGLLLIRGFERRLTSTIQDSSVYDSITPAPRSLLPVLCQLAFLHIFLYLFLYTISSLTYTLSSSLKARFYLCSGVTSALEWK